MTVWNFSCHEDGTSYNLQIGPSQGLDPQFRRTVAYGIMEHTNDPATLLVKALEPVTGSLKGTLLSHVQYTALGEWWQKTRRVQITDRHARRFTVLITELDRQRVLSASHPWKHTWTMQLEVLQIVFPSINGAQPTIEPAPYLSWSNAEGTWADHPESWTEVTA